MIESTDETRALAAYEAQRVASGQMCAAHHAPMPCEFCERYLPVALNGRVVTFDLAALTAEQREGARAVARLIQAALLGGES